MYIYTIYINTYIYTYINFACLYMKMSSYNYSKSNFIYAYIYKIFNNLLRDFPLLDLASRSNKSA